MSTRQITEIVDDLGGHSAPLLQVLLAVQDAQAQRYLSEAAAKEIASCMNISRSRVYSTASFYSEISLVPRGRHIVRICINAPCENAGRKEIARTVTQELGIAIGETTKDGLFTLEAVSCLGACYMSPAIKIDDEIYGNLTSRQAAELLKAVKEEVPIC